MGQFLGRWQRGGDEAYLGPRSSAEHSLRFRDSALAGSEEFSLTPLILNAYQRLGKNKTQTQELMFSVNAQHQCVNTHMQHRAVPVLTPALA